jgi:hypothetical protein
MTIYNPNNWVILKIFREGKPYYKVLGGWSGGYLDGDSWKLNSGIAKVNLNGDYFEFLGYSGSIYKCHKDSNIIRMNIAHAIASLEAKYGDSISVMDSSTDWLTLDYSY